MHINFGSVIQIKNVFVVNKTDKYNNMPAIKPSTDILQALSKRINNKNPNYISKLSLIDKEFNALPCAATIRKNSGVACLLTGKSATEYRQKVNNFYRTAQTGPKPDNEDFISKQNYLYDTNNRKIYIDLFVKQNGTKEELIGMKFVDFYEKPPLMYDCDDKGQLLLPLEKKQI